MLKFLFYNSLFGILASAVCAALAIHHRDEFALFGWISSVGLWIPVVIHRWKTRNDLRP